MCSQEIASTQYDTEKEYLIRTVRNKRDFSNKVMINTLKKILKKLLQN